jgi:hypothetical protein
MVYLIGCDHFTAQTYPEGGELGDPANTTQRKFSELLIKSIEVFSPDLIAEELHPSSLRAQRRRSVAFEVASGNRTTHRFCEAYGEERRKLGISDAPPYAPPDWDNHEPMRRYFSHEWPIREEFWISQLGEDIHKRTLFICGAGHRETLRRRLERRAIEVKIIEKRFGALSIWNGDFPAYKAAYRDLRRSGFQSVS